MPVRGGSTFTEEQTTDALMAVVAWAGNYNAATKYLSAEKGLTINQGTLRNWCTSKHAERYQELREKYSAQLEENLIRDYREVSALATNVERLAIEKAEQRLLSGDDSDPSRTAANLARVKQVNTDKLLSLSGRPTSIREDRNLDEVLRGLIAMKVISMPELEASVTEGEVVADA